MAPPVRLSRPLRRLFWCLTGLLVLSDPASAEPPKPDQLIIREWPGTWGEAMQATVLKMFTERTGIPMVVDYRVDGAMSTMIQVAAAQGRQPPVDIFYTMENQAYKDAARGLMLPLTPQDIPNLDAMLPNARPIVMQDGGWPYVNVGSDVAMLVYREAAFPKGPPQSLTVLFDPRFKGRVLGSTESLGSIELVALANDWHVPGDMDKIWSFIADRLKSQDPILGGDPVVVNALERGEADLAFTYPANVMGLEHAGVAWTLPKEGMAGASEGIWIPRGLPESNTYWAKQFVNFLLSREVLETYCAKLYIPCFRRDMSPPPQARNDPNFPRTPEQFAAIHSLPLADATTHEVEWDARYDSIMK